MHDQKFRLAASVSFESAELFAWSYARPKSAVNAGPVGGLTAEVRMDC